MTILAATVESAPPRERRDAPGNGIAPPLRLALPKGRMAESVEALLRDAGVRVMHTSRGYRPIVAFDAVGGVDTKMLKPQSIVEMLVTGSRDLGFTGSDWVAELGADLVDLLDTGLDPVRIVAAVPTALLDEGRLPARPLLVATEYVHLTRRWIAARGLDAQVVRSYGATEVYPPEDADFIVDNTATGSTLSANRLEIIDTLMTSSTRLYANPRALDDAVARDRIEHIVVLLRSVLEARRRVILELNVPRDRLENVLAVLPCMREPTVAQLAGDAGYAVKVAVLRDVLPALIAEVRAHGGTDLIVTRPSQIVP